MKMAKASERDIDAAGNAMGILDTISRDYYPSREGENESPLFFDADNFDHLRRFYDEMVATLDASPGWPGRVIGGMCYVILYDANRIIDPKADVLEIHPRFAAMERALNLWMVAYEADESHFGHYGKEMQATRDALAAEAVLTA